jgi:hypothetical protein
VQNSKNRVWILKLMPRRDGKGHAFGDGAIQGDWIKCPKYQQSWVEVETVQITRPRWETYAMFKVRNW